MGAFLNSLFSTIGRTGSEAAQGQQQARQNSLEEQARQLQMIQSKIALDEINQRMGIQAADEKRKQQEEYRKTPEGHRSYLKEMLQRNPTDEEIQRDLGVAPPKMSDVERKREDYKDAVARGDTKGTFEEWVAEETAKGHAAGTPSKANFDPIIAAQLAYLGNAGKPPDPKKFPKGEDDPAYIAAAETWGVAAEAIKNRMIGARGEGYNMTKIYSWVTPEGDLKTAMGKVGLANGWTLAAPAIQLLPRETQMREMQDASSHMRSAIIALQPGDAFTAETTAVLNAASGMLQHGGDPSIFASMIANEAAKTLNKRQRDYLNWLGQMGERVLSLRSVLGMGQGAQDVRAAIQSTLPNINSGSKEFALERLDSVDQLLNRVFTGIPKSAIDVNRSGPNTAPPNGGKIIRVTPEMMNR